MVVDYSQYQAREDLVRQELRALRRRTFRVKKALLQLVRTQGGPERFVLRPRDEQRLLIFAVWAERHRVPLRYVMQTLISWWKAKVKRPGTRRTVLGVRLTTLTSRKSELILKDCISRDYPGRENEAEWELRERRRLLGLDEMRGKAKPLLDPANFSDAILYYSARVEKRQKKLDKAAEGQWRRRRRWRGNPWL